MLPEKTELNEREVTWYGTVGEGDYNNFIENKNIITKLVIR